jgi:hypothetical protein
MNISFNDNSEEIGQFLDEAQALAKQGAAAAATAGAEYLMNRAKQDTMMRSQHPTGSWHHTKGGEPPAIGSGNLVRTMYVNRATGELFGEASWGNSSDYGRILEFGCRIFPVSKKFMHWEDSGGSWYHKFLDVPPHPYIRTTTEEAIDDGGLHEAMVDEFRKYDP